MEVFWEQGFRRASMADLEAATGVLRGSLYWAFGDKRAIFERALEHYRSLTRRSISAHLEGDEPAADLLRGALLAVAEDCTGAGGHRGCLVANSAIEMAPHDEEVRAALSRHYEWMADRFAELLDRAVAEGSLPPGRDPRALGRLVVVSIQGLRVVGKTGPRREDLESVVDELLAGLGLQNRLHGRK
ncbi:MAG: TetR/AcrR family transcriptional regulator [Holophagales bacterium]|nr:TetR/AcrR family transcriptional regulator [Holophagales bacterium]